MKAKAKHLVRKTVEVSNIFNKETEGRGGKITIRPITKKEKKWTTMKVIVMVCLINGIAWVWCSYILAWLGKEQIAESLSQVALTEIIGVVLVYAAKSVFENLSKNNSWPDKPGSDPPDGVG